MNSAPARTRAIRIAEGLFSDRHRPRDSRRNRTDFATARIHTE